MTIVLRTALTIGLGGVLLSSAAVAQTQLKASHQWPGGKGDVRDEMVQIIAREVEGADVDLSIRIYPAASLFKPRQQWDAMAEGQLDISAFPLDYASGKHPQFSATLMPGAWTNHEYIDCECCEPAPCPPPQGRRITIGTFTWPPVR